MKQLIIQNGKTKIVDVPVPQVGAGHCLVRVANSSISKGTELAGIRASETPIWKKALKDPLKAIDTLSASNMSFTQVLDSVQIKSSAIIPSGYSASGIIQKKGSGVSNDFQVGDRVACAGSQCAFHAEYISIPENLLVKIPESVSFQDASTVTLGSIALQGVRRLNPTIGETFVVIGLGILGLLSIQILKANGCKVIGLDLDEHKIKIAQSLGIDVTFSPGASIESSIYDLTDGNGVDGALITASSSSSEIISQSFKYCRKKARVVIVGDIGLDLKRADFYEKEIDILISTSYGPGRYDTKYEDQGLDYPISYVRWTENRNMIAYIELLNKKSIDLDTLKSNIYSIDAASEAFEALDEPGNDSLINILDYHIKDNSKPNYTISYENKDIPKSLHASSFKKIAVIGPGAFARNTILPVLRKSFPKISIDTIVVREGYKSLEIQKTFKVNKVSTSFKETLANKDIDTILITTQHHLHAQMVLDGLEAKKNIFVEKPLALSHEQLDTLFEKINLLQRQGINFNFMVGYNRRFSPAVEAINKITSQRSKPMIINYVMNAGFLPQDHWVHGEKGGGRNIGEACHIYDLFTFFTQSEVASISAASINCDSASTLSNDNFSAIITFKDGSICNLIYTALGDSSYPKEKAEIFVDGKVIFLNNYKEVTVYENNRSKKIASRLSSKGYYEEFSAFFNEAGSGEHFPIPLWQIYQASKIALDVEALISNNAEI